MKKILHLRYYLLIGLLFLLLSIGNIVKGASFTAIQNGNWDNPATWGGSGIPGIGDDITISAGVIVSMNVNGTCRSITDMPGGSISGLNSLTIIGVGGVAITDISGTATILCPLVLPALASITVSGTLAISGVLSGAATNLTKSGTGKLILSGTNLYDGITTVDAGILNLQNGQGAGSSVNGIVVNNAAQLELESTPMMAISEALSLSGSGATGGSLINKSGTNIWFGSIDIDGVNCSISSTLGDLLVFGALNLKANIITILGASNVFIPGMLYTSTGTGSIVKDGAGELSFGNQNISINALTINNGTLKTTSGTLNLAGDFINNGIFDNNSGSLGLTGTAAQNIGGSQQTIFNNLSLNNSSGATLGNSEIVDGTLTLTNGNLIIGSNDLTLGAAAVAGNPSVTNMIVADGGGECRRIFTGIGSYVFPIGDKAGIVEYSPVTLNFTSGTFASGSFAGVQVTDGQHPQDNSAADFITRYWSVNLSGISSATYDFTATFINTGADINGNIANIVTGIWSGSPAAWSNSGIVTAPTISASGVTSSADFAGISLIPSSLSVSIAANPSLAVCQGASLTLTAIAAGNPGFTYLWSPNGEITQAVTPPTSSSGPITYSVTVSDANSNSVTKSVTVTVNALPTATISGSTTVCQNQSLPLITFTGTGGTAPYVFTYSFNGGTSTNTSQGNPVTINAVTGTPGIDTYTLLSVSDANTCSQAQSGLAMVTVDPSNVGGSISGSTTVCSGTNSTLLTLSGYTGTVTKWQYSIDGGASWTDIANTATTYTTNNLTVTTEFRAEVQSGICPSANSLSAAVIVDPPSVGGIITGGTTVCSGTNSTLLTLSGQTGAITKWQYSTNGGATWIDISNTETTFTASNLVITTDFRAVVQDGVCTPDNSLSATVTVIQASVGGSVAGSSSVCIGINSTMLTLSDQTGTVIKWQYSTNGGTTWTDISSTGITYTAINLIVSTDFRAVVQNGTCISAYSVPATVTVIAASIGGAVSGGASVCPGTNNTLLTLSGQTGTIIKWQYSNNGGTSWTDISNTGTTFTAANLVVTTDFKAVVQNGTCTSAISLPATVTIIPASAGGVVNGGASVCSGANSTLLTLSGQIGTVIKWQYSTNGGSSWTDISNTGTSYTATNLNVTTDFKAVVQNGSCAAANSVSATVTVIPACLGGSVTGGGGVCSGANSTLLTLSGQTGTVIKWQYSTNGGTTWADISNTGTTYTATNLVVTTYYRAAVQNGNGVCPVVYSATEVITINPIVTSGTIGTAQTICYNSIPAGLTELTAATGGAGNYTYQWQSSANNSTWTTIPDSTLITLAPGVLVSNLYYRRIVTSGSCGSATSTGILITVRPILIASVASGSRTICYNTVPLALTATSSSGGSGTFTYQWQSSPDNTLWANISGANNYSSYTPAALATTTYFRLLAIATGTPACGTAISNVLTITVLPDLISPVASVDQTICYNTAPAILSSTSATGGNGLFNYQWFSSLNNLTWNLITGATGTTYQPSALTASTYFRIVATASGVPSCGNRTSNAVLITVNSSLTAGTIGTAQTICYNTIPAILTELVSATGGTGTYTYQWQSSPNNITWTTIADSTSPTIAPGALAANMYYRRIVTSGSCGTANSNGILITVRPILTVPIASASRTICYNTIPSAMSSLPATGGSGTFTYQWQSSPDNSVWTNIAGATNFSSYAPATALTTTTYYRLVATATGTPACGTATSNVLAITVLPDLITPVASADQVICYNTVPLPLTSTTATGGNETFSYQWYSSTNNSTWNFISGATGTTYQPSALTTSTYYHIVATATGSPACGNRTSNSVLITVYANITAGTIGTAQTICYNTIPVGIAELTTATGGTGSYSYQWQSSPNNSTWTTITDSILPTLAPGALVANIYYRRIVTSGSCGTATSTSILITVRPSLTAPVASASRIICFNTIPSALTATNATGGSGIFTYQWQKSPDNSVWSDITGATNYWFYSPPVLTSTTYYRLVATALGTPACGTVTSNVIIVTVLPDLNSPVVSTDQNICYNTIPLQITSTAATGGNETFTYQWYSSLNNSTWLLINGETGLTYQPPALTTSTYYRIVATATGIPACGNKISNAILVTVNPSPVAIATPGAQTICSGVTSSIILTSAVTGTTFSWTVAKSDVSGATAGSGLTIAQALTATNITAGTATYSITPSANGCTGVIKTVVVTVNPVPVAIATPALQTRCSGAATSIALVSNVLSTSFSWTVVQSGVSGASAGSGSSIVQTLTAIGTTSGTATYSITPTAGSCSGTPITVIITVNPSPIATVTPNTQTICSGTATSVALSSNISGTTFSWIAAQSGVTGATAASGSAITQTLNAVGTIAGTVTYSVTPSANGCAGLVKTAVITVNPNPVVTATPASQTICSGGVSSIVLTSPVSGATFAWTNVISPSGSITGATNGTGSSIAQTLVNTTWLQANVTYSVIPTANSCSGNPLDVMVTVNPLATLSSPLSASVCSNSLFGYTPTSNTPLASFSWTRAAVIGIQNAAGSGTGSVSEILINTTGIAKMVIYSYTLSSYGCTKNQSVVVIVFPSPTLTSSLSPPSVCSSAMFSYNAISSVSGTTLTWVRAVAANISNAAAMGTGDIYEPLVSTSASDVTVSYVYSLSVGGCTSNFTVVATVKPTPTLTVPSNQVYCNGANVPSIIFNGTVAGTIYTWGNNNTAIGLAASGTGNIPSFTAINATTTLITALISVRPSASGCNGSNSSFTIAIDPASQGGTVSSDAVVCSGANTGMLTLSGHIGTVSKWQSSTDGGSNWIDISNTTTSQTYTNLTVATQYRAVVQSGVCLPSYSPAATITVNPATVGGAVNADATVCFGTNTGTLTLSGQTGSVTRWQSSINGGTNWIDISNSSTTQIYTNLTITTQYKAVVQNGACASANSSVAIITVNPLSVGGSVSGSATVCFGNNSTTLTLTGYTGSIIKWQSSTLSDFSSGVSDISNTTPSLAVTNLAATSYYRAVLTNGVCSSVNSTYATIIVNPLPTAIAGGSQTICSTGTATVSSASASNGTIAWTENGAGSITSGATTLTPIYTAAVGDASTIVTLTMTVTSSNACAPQAATAIYTITVNALPSATAGGSQTICSNGTAIISGASSSNGTIAWTENGAGSITSGATTLTPTYTAALADAGTTVTLTMTVTSNNACIAQIASATYSVIVNPLPTAIAGGSQTICSNGTATVSGASSTNGTIAWTENGAGTITSGATTLTPVYTAAAADAGTTVTLTMTVTSTNACAPQTAIATYSVTVNQASIGGSIAGNAMVCSGINSTVLTLNGSSGSITKWQLSTVAGFTSGVTDIANTTTNLTATNLNTTTYYRVVVQSGSCAVAYSSVGTITVNPTPTLVITDPLFVCSPGKVNLTVASVTAGSTAGLILTYWIDVAATTSVTTPSAADNDTYYIKGTTAAGCYDIKPVVATVTTTIGNPVFAAGATSVVCNSSPPILYSAPAANAVTLIYAIDAASFAGGNRINSSTGLLTFALGYTGNITITASASGCGTSSAFHVVTVNPAPTVVLTASAASVCQGGSVTLTATNSGGITQKTASGTNSTSFTIPNNSLTGATSTISLSGFGGAALSGTNDIIVVTLNITHSRDREVDIFLVDPNGTKAMLLSTGNGGTGANYTNTILRTDAANIIGSAGNNAASFNGTYATEGNMNTAPLLTGAAANRAGSYTGVIPTTALNGALLDGTWTLRVFDNNNNSYSNNNNSTGGTLTSWSLQIIHQLSSGYTSVVNGNPVISVVSYSGTNNSTATAVVTPPVGSNIYTVTTTDGNGCSTTSAPVTVVVNPLPTPTITSDYCSDRPKVRLTTGSYSGYLWSNGATTQSTLVDIAGNYTVTVTDANGCSGIASSQVADELIVNGSFSNGNTGVSGGYTWQPDIAGNTELHPQGLYSVVNLASLVHTTFYGAGHNGTGDYFMIVNGSTANPQPVVWRQNITVVPGTTYYFAAWARSAKKETNHVAYPYADLKFSINDNQLGVSTGTLPDGPASNTDPLTWVRFYGFWTAPTGVTSAKLEIVDLITASGGNDFCLDDISFGTLVNVPFTVSVSSNSPALSSICSRGTLNLTSTVVGGKPPVVYTWTGPNSFTSNLANPTILAIPPSGAGTYTLSVTDAYNCPAVVATTVVVLKTTPEIQARTATICSGSSFDATPVNGSPSASTIVPAGTTYTWAAPTVFPVGTITGATSGTGLSTIGLTLTNISNAPATVTYTVIPVDTGCTGNSFTDTVTVNPIATANAGSNQQICAGSTATLSGSVGRAATSGSWTGGTGTFFPDRNALAAVYTPSAAEVTAGSATLTLNSDDPDGAGPCSAATSTVVITINPLPGLTKTPTHVNCFGGNTGAIDLTVTRGGATPGYSWTASAGGVILPGQSSSQDLTGLISGTYSVVVTGIGGCTATTSVTIIQPAAALTASAAFTGMLCEGGTTGTITLTVSGGTPNYTYLWTAGGGGIIPSGQSTAKNLTGLVSGTYSVTITDANMCTVSILNNTVNVAANTAPVITTCPVTQSFNGCSTASMTGPGFSATQTSSTYAVFSNSTNQGIATDNCAITTVTYQDIATTDCPIVVTRTWSLGDAGGLTTTCQQIITITDIVAPTWTTAVANLNRSVECSDASGLAAALALFPTATDVCDTDVSNIVKTTGSFVAAIGCSQRGTYTNTFIVTDECGNISPVYTQVITITDNTAPTWTTTAGSLNRTMECTDISDLAIAQALVPAAMDNCDADVTNVIKVTGSFVVGTCGNKGTFTNTWTIVDDCGNVSGVFTQLITITDNTAPVWLTAPGELNRMVACNNAGDLVTAQALSPVASDNCTANVSALNKTNGSFVRSGACLQEGTYTNTWTVSDGCGNTSVVYTQVITIEDNAGPVIHCPADDAFSCDSPSFDPSITGTATVIDNCDASPVVIWADVILPGTCAGNYQITRTWRATDACGKYNTCGQAISVQDVTPPVITCAVTGNQNVYPNPALPYVVPDNSWDATATDNCSGVTLSATLSGATVSGAHSTLNGVSFNEGVTTVTWTAIDGCGISSHCQFTITVSFRPVINCPANIISNNDAEVCNATLNPGVPSLVVGTAPIVYTWAMTGATIGSGTGPVGHYTFNKGATTITWTATNAAGAGVCTQTITVIDNQPPTFSVPMDKEYCVSDIYQADFDAPTIDISPARPDYYLFIAGNADLDLNPATFADNCPSVSNYEIRWRLDFQDGTFLPALPDTLITGQPSVYGVDIQLPGNAITSLLHHITYYVVDCSGNIAAPKTVSIIIKPRPDVIKTTVH